jgi:hypothetical protein
VIDPICDEVKEQINQHIRDNQGIIDDEGTSETNVIDGKTYCKNDFRQNENILSKWN